MHRTWHKRRIVWTHGELQFSRVGDLQLVDKIPMHEILCATKMSRMSFNVHGNDNPQQKSKKEDSKIDAGKRVNHTSSLAPSKRGNTSPLDNTIQIKTISDGHNSGRTYYFCLQSEEAFEHVISEVTKLAKAARKRAHVSSRFEKAKLRVRKVYDSKLFQKSTAILIIAVRFCNLVTKPLF